MIAATRLVTGGAVIMLSLGVLLVVGGLTPVVVGSPLAQQQPAPAPSVSPVVPAATPTPLSLQTLTQIQPGLSTYMMETAQRFGIMWFAAKHQNWDLAAFEAREAKGVLQHGAVRSNQSRQQGIDAFNSGLLDPLIAAAQAGDQAQFEATYRSAIDGCNACHASQNYGQINRPFSFVKLQVPTNSPDDVYAYTAATP